MSLLPRVACITDPVLIWTMIVANSLVFLAYQWIPLTTITIVLQRNASPAARRLFSMLSIRRMRRVIVLLLLLGSLFVVSCGYTHLIGAVVFFSAIYWIEAVVLCITAIVSIAFALVYWVNRPRILAIIDEHDRLEARVLDLQRRLEGGLANGLANGLAQL